MKYWLYDGRDAQGPYDEAELARLPGFSPESLICPDGAASADQWKPSRLHLPPRPAPDPLPPPETRASSAFPKAVPAGEIKQPKAVEPAVKTDPALAPVAGESPEAIRLRLAQALPARKMPEPEAPPPQPEPTPAQNSARALKRVSLAAAALAVAGALAFAARHYAAQRAARVIAPTAPIPALAASTKASLAPDAQAAIDFTRDFPLQSAASKLPADAMDVFLPKTWSSPRTLQELYDRRALMALGQASMRTLERQGHTVAEAARELQRSPKLWQQHSQRFLERRYALQWSAEPSGEGFKVTARLRYGAEEELRSFEVNPAARTLKPLTLDSWYDVDQRQSVQWGNKYLRLSEELNEAVAGPQTPVYTLGAAKAGRVKAAVAAARPPPHPLDDDEEDSGPEAIDDEMERPAPAPLALANPPSKAARPSPRPEAKPEPEAKPDEVERPREPAQAPQPPQSPSDPKRKSVTDMSVDELQKYLSR